MGMNGNKLNTNLNIQPDVGNDEGTKIQWGKKGRKYNCYANG